MIDIPIVMLSGYLRKFNCKGNAKFNFLEIIWERKCSRISESLKLKILATMEQLPGYIGLITNLPF